MSKQTASKPKLFSFKYLVYDFILVTAALPGLLWLRPKWIFATKQARRRIRGGAIVIANHAGFLDPVYVMFAVWYRRHRFVCRQEFFATRARWLFQAVRCIPVDRENMGLGSLRAITAAAQSGSLISLFPEGHVNDGSGKMADFKSGMVLMALQSRVPIVPIYIKPPRRFYHRLRVVIGEPVDVTALYGARPTLSQIDEMAALLREREEQLAQLADPSAHSKEMSDRA